MITDQVLIWILFAWLLVLVVGGLWLLRRAQGLIDTQSELIDAQRDLIQALRDQNAARDRLVRQSDTIAAILEKDTAP